VFCFKLYPTFAFTAKGIHKTEVALYISVAYNSVRYILNVATCFDAAIPTSGKHAKSVTALL